MRSAIKRSTRASAPRRTRRPVSLLAKVGAVSAAAMTLASVATLGGTSAAATPRRGATTASAASAGCRPGAVKLTMWGWAAGYNLAVNEFNKTHPKICVLLEDDGASNVEYTKIQDAEKAGTGAPDVAEMEYFVLPSFEITKSLLNLVPYGVKSYQANEVKVAWNQVSKEGGVYAMPVDVGPLAFYYNASVLSKYGITVPKTWAQYATAAATLAKKDPGAQLGTIDWTDDQPMLAMMQEYKAFPFVWNGGSKLTIDFTGNAQMSFANFWQKQLRSHQVGSYVDFSAQQWNAWDSEKVAARFSPAWGPVGMQLSIKNTLGDWRAAQIPQVVAGGHRSGNWGGSTVAVLASSKHPKQAAEFAEWFGGTMASWKILSGPVAGAYPGYKPMLDSPSFLSTTLKISGPEHFQAVFAAAAKDMTAAEWPPIMNEVNTIWPTVFAGVSSGKETLPQAFRTIQSDLVKYAQAQGFSVTQ